MNCPNCNQYMDFWTIIGVTLKFGASFLNWRYGQPKPPLITFSGSINDKVCPICGKKKEDFFTKFKIK